MQKWTETRNPSATRSSRWAPQFWPTNGLRPELSANAGMSASASTRAPMPYAATAVSP